MDGGLIEVIDRTSFDLCGSGLKRDQVGFIETNEREGRREREGPIFIFYI